MTFICPECKKPIHAINPPLCPNCGVKIKSPFGKIGVQAKEFFSMFPVGSCPDPKMRK
jgi:predicted amidophosphoribosyltransferase